MRTDIKKISLLALSLVLVFLLFALFAPSTFSQWRNIQTIIRQTTIVGCSALGMTLVIILGGIDLSVGSIIALTTVVLAEALASGFSTLIALPLAVLAGTLSGLLNGLLITRLKVVPFIVTLGSLLVIRGIGKGIAAEQKVDAPLTWLVDLLSSGTGSSLFIFPAGVWLFFILALFFGFLLHFTTFGRHIIAVGSNEEAAHLCGVPVARRKVVVYTLSGFATALAGVLQFSRLTVGDPTVALGLELDVIAAVVIGGGSLAGGEGSIIGTIIGALLMTTLRSGCSQLGLSNWVQEIITGGIIIGAVTLDRYRRGQYS